MLPRRYTNNVYVSFIVFILHNSSNQFLLICLQSASVARFPESSKLTAMPRDISAEEMERVVKIARQHVDEISAFEWHVWNNMLAPWQNSAAYSYSATTYVALIGQQEGWKGLQSVEASRKLANL